MSRPCAAPNMKTYEVNDPARVPSRGVAIFGALAALLVLIGVGLWYGTNLFRGQENGAPPLVVPTDTPPSAAEPTPVPAKTGQVTLTGKDEVWLRVYEADGTPRGATLFENTLKAGDHFDVPLSAKNPLINVGRPDKLQITVNGSAVAALGDGKVALKDVPISAAALLARPAARAPESSPTPAATTLPVTRATTASSVQRQPARQVTPPRPAPSPAALNIAAPVVPAATPTP